ncbi:CSEP0443 putative effector protein [Blumeria hordei DH14]|uniref:CSEP0443 putative effector protein n=1 Tax=Blumeria graminis f. sp. hordei (strain DH14) TaxID=546991 RepID=N1JH18_BLUG1|nr:CSEP0443 putative effector protein [Blumeria hordei DH14]
MKNLSFVSLALFLSHLMPVLAAKYYTCGGVLIPGSRIEVEVETKKNSLQVVYYKHYLRDEEYGRVNFNVDQPPEGSSPLIVEVAFNLMGVVLGITATRDNVSVDCK